MQIKNNYKKLLNILISISVLECVYLFALPPIANHFLNNGYLEKIVQEKTNAKINHSRIKLKTHILPYLTFKTNNIELLEKETNIPFINAKDVNVKISILPLLKQKLNIKHIYASNANINIERNQDGTYNFEKLFPSKEQSKFVLHYGSIKIGLKKYSLTLKDEQNKQTISIDGNPLIIKNKLKKKYIKIKTIGEIVNNQNKQSNYDIDLKFKYPFNNYTNEIVTGRAILYDIDLNPIFPLIQKYTDNKITKLSGNIDYIQFSADSSKNNSNHVSLNTKFQDFIFDMKGWGNYIQANGENTANASVDLIDNKINVDSFNYKADNIDIHSNGNIILEKQPTLDIDIEVKNSRTENIASILPPNLVPQYKTIEKIKNYGVFGDIDGKVSIKGQVPNPDITGWVKGRDVHILDKSIHHLHKGTVDINFDKHKLNMNILVDMFNNQKAEIKGYTYMYRDGINDVTIKTTNNIDFPLAQKIVIPISKVFNFMLGPIPDMNITSGKGIIDMRIRGAIDYIDMNGYCKFNQANLTYNGLYANIHNGSGKLDFDGDVISFKSDKLYIKNNLVNVDGKVQINDNLDYNISTTKAEAKDLFELINKSSLLKDVKSGLAVITSASGPMTLKVNIKSKIVPVPYGQPPLPPEEAFFDMKVKGSVDLFDNKATIIGFETPIYDIKGNVEYTETVTTINNIDAKCEKSPINIKGKVINDLKTKIPFVDMTIKSDAIYLGDTIKFLTRSYLYPNYYPDLSSLYNLNSQHDLYFTYKAKSIDFITNKAFAEMNFITDTSDSPLRAKNGKITMKNANVYVENVNADLLGSNLNINGDVKRVDTLNPIYNLDIFTEKFNLENINNVDKYDIIPNEAKSFINQFKDFKGFADFNVILKKNIIDSNIELFKPHFVHKTTNIPFDFDDFTVNINSDKVSMDNVTAYIGDMPFFGNIKLSNIYKAPNLDSYFTTKLTDKFVQDYFPEDISKKIKLIGDINLSADVKGTQNNLNIKPKLTFYPDSDVIIEGIRLGETADTREFNGNIDVQQNKIDVKKLDYIKYIVSQNNISYHVLFATGSGIVNINKEKNTYQLQEATIKTEKNLSAKLLNIFLKQPIFKQGSLNCDLKYTVDNNNKIAKITGKLDSRNLDIPLFDTVVKNIRLDAKDDNIDINVFGFLNDSRFKVSSLIENNIYTTPKIQNLTISADTIDNDKILRSLAKARKAMTTNNKIKNTDFSGIHLENGNIDIQKLLIKSLVAENVKGNFSIDENGIFSADNLKIDVGQGNIEGKLLYDLNDNEIQGDFELTNVDSNYVAETLFDGKNQVYGNASGKIILSTQGTTNEEIIQNMNGLIFFEIKDGRMPKLGSLEYLLRAGNIIKNGITGLTINSILQLLNLVKTGYFSKINGSCIIDNGIAKDIEIYSTGENMSLYIHGDYDISNTTANMEVLGKLSNRISTIFGSLGNTSLNTFFKLIPGISLLDFRRKDIIENVEKIPPFTNGDYESRVFQAIINGDINSSKYVQSFKWVKN